MNDMSPTIPRPFGLSERDAELFRLIRAGETARIREALEGGADPEARERVQPDRDLSAVRNTTSASSATTGSTPLGCSTARSTARSS